MAPPGPQQEPQRELTCGMKVGVVRSKRKLGTVLRVGVDGSPHLEHSTKKINRSKRKAT